MANLETNFAIEAWRILLFARNGAELLLLKQPPGLCLPVLRIPRHERLAASLNAEVQRCWNLDSVSVAPFRIAHPDRTVGEAPYYVMEVRKPEELSRIAPKTMDAAGLKAHAFSDVRDYLAIRRAMKIDDSSCNPEGPFGAFESFRKISRWVEEQLEPLGRKWEGGFDQWQATEAFALIRFQTTDGAVWFKATGEPNRMELAITQHLSALFPAWMPELIAVRHDWNGWLSDEVRGGNLAASGDRKAWCCAAEALAELQVASAGHASSILDHGAHDSRSRKLRAKVLPFFEEIEILMQGQTKSTPRPLGSSEVRALGLRVTEALEQIESAAIPDALNHFDLNPANAIVRSSECRFLDWAEAAVGNPFFSFEYLRQHFLRMFGAEPEAAMELRESYVKVWRRILSRPVIDLAIELMPLVAPFAFAVTTLPWNSSRRSANPEFAGFLRSLARRMHREAGQLSRAA
jgi:hypothetical protein